MEEKPVAVKTTKSKNLLKWSWVIALGAFAGLAVGYLAGDYNIAGIIGAICGVAVYVVLYLRN